MFYYLSLLADFFGPFRLFEYVTFRAGAAAFTAFLVVILFGGKTAALLRRLNARAADRMAGLVPPGMIDKEKSKTPCMGGLLLIGGVVVSAMLWCSPQSRLSWILLGGTFGFMLIGFLDDWMKVVLKRRDGLPGRLKLLGQFLVAGAVVAALDMSSGGGGLTRQLMVPFMKSPLPIGLWAPVLSVVVIVGASNAVNLTDGKDGLATGCTIFCALAYAVFAYLMGHRVFADYLNIPHILGIGEAVIFAGALGGGCIGFLWHNCHPASMFMGDTGSLALGGAIGMLAVMTRQEILLLLVGGVFVIEALSVILQVASFKMTGKRIFLCAPIHHHFERLGWTETQIVVRFWIFAGLFALGALATLKLR